MEAKMRSRYIRTLAGILAAALVIGGCGGTESGVTSQDAAGNRGTSFGAVDGSLAD